MANLERLLGIDRDLRATASYPLLVTRSKWEAVQQGERLMQEEPHRLQLGVAPLAHVTKLLRGSGITLGLLHRPIRRSLSHEFPQSLYNLI